MSTDQKAPRDIVEGGPERDPEGQDEPRRAPQRQDVPSGERDAGKDASKDATKKDDSPRQGDVPPWYQPESGQPGTSRK